MKVLQGRQWRALCSSAAPRSNAEAAVSSRVSVWGRTMACCCRVRRRAGVMAASKSIAMVLLAAASIGLAVGPLTGCSGLHLRSQQPQAPPLKTGPGHIDEEQSKSHQQPPASTLPQPTTAEAQPQLPPVKQPKVKRRKKRRPAEPPPQVQQDAAIVPATPIGKLTTGDSKSAEQNKRDTKALIQQTNQGLDQIKHALSPEERTTMVQIRTFLTQAQQALDNGDADGARTLATKAKLLLDELAKK